ncbi:MAG TPA: chloride channel protein [Xanthobacteraceae bacterium]|jgi:CIC family chloride channel protein|nr:chloride channel protein [Xanthobacteraceae bacterium]
MTTEFETAPVTHVPVRRKVQTAHFGLATLCVLAAVVGTATGFGALLFRLMIGFVHNLFFLGVFSTSYDSSQFTPAHPWGAAVILVPVIGAVIVTFIVSNFAPEAKGHGVPEVMDAIYYKEGAIRPVVAAVKSIASAVAIGTGSAVGREGPIIQIGSALGSSFGQLMKLTPSQRIVLVAAGAGAGIAATFNTPIGGVLFVTELMLPEVSVNTFLPVATATGIATFLGRLFFGPDPAFFVPVMVPLPNSLGTGAFTLLLYVVLGAVTGIAAAGFIRGLHLVEDAFDKIPGRYLRHMIGMLLVGILIFVLFRYFGHYYVEGVGYSTIQAILNNQLAGAGLLALLFICKLAATTTSLGSGSSGGVFSPSLYMGATLGAAFAALLAQVFHLPVDVPAFAMVGMGAMVGGGTGAALTAVTMIFEMTRDYNIVLPMILAVGASLATRRVLSRENIYTLKLIRRGHPVPRGLHANMFLVQKAKDVMQTDVPIVPAEMTLSEFLQRPDNHGAVRHVVVTRGNRISGVLRINTGIRQQFGSAQASITLGDVARPDFTIVQQEDAVFDVIRRMSRREVPMALVMASPSRRAIPRPQHIRGIITKEHVADSVAKTVEIYPH